MLIYSLTLLSIMFGITVYIKGQIAFTYNDTFVSVALAEFIHKRDKVPYKDIRIDVNQYGLLFGSVN